MAWLTREQVKQIVTEALEEIADFTGDVEQYLISEIDDVYKENFGNKIQDKLNAKGFEVDLSLEGEESGLNNMESINELIDYIQVNQMKVV